MMKAKSVMISVAIIAIAVSSVIIKAVSDGASATDETSKSNQKVFSAAENGDIGQVKQPVEKGTSVSGQTNELNQELEKAVRVADFFEVGKLMITDALSRNESCGAHFREESQTEGGEAMRDDENYKYVSVWEYMGEEKPLNFHKENLKFENVELKVRSYK